MIRWRAVHELERLANLKQELQYLLNHWDPAGVCDPELRCPPDEYDCPCWRRC